MTTEQIRYEFEVVTGDAIKELDDFSSAFNALGRSFKQAGSLSKSVSKTFGGVTKSVKGLTTAFSALTGVAIGKALSDGAKEAIDLYESINLLKVTFGDASGEAQEFVEHITDMYGFDTRTIVDMMGSFKAMGNAVGMTNEVSTDLAKSLTALTIDLSSLHNMELESTFQRVQSSMQGMSKSAKMLKMDIRATTVEAWANANGINRQFETMSEAERELLRYTLMVKQARDAMGDFANTAELPANQLRILNQQFTELGRMIGQFFTPVLQQVLPVLIGLAMALRTIVEMLAIVFGVNLDWDKIAGRDNSDGLYDTAGGLDEVGASADGAAKKINKLLAPFDELNILSESTGSSGFGGGVNFGEIDPAILDLFYQMQYEATEAALKAQEFKKQILDFLGITYDNNKKSWVFAPIVFKEHLQDTFKFAEQTIEALFNLDYKRLSKNLGNVFADLGNIFKRTLGIILEDFERLTGIDFSDSTFANWINNLNTNLENLHTWLRDNQEEIATFIARFVEFAGAFAILSAVLAPIGDLLIGMGIALAVIGHGFGAVSGILSGIVSIGGAISNALGYARTFLFMLGQSIPASFGVLAVAIAVLVAGFINGFKRMWDSSEQFRTNLGTLVGNIGTVFTSIVSVVANAINLIIAIFQPIVETIGEILQPLFPLVVGIINAIVGVVQGLLDIINGLLTGDLSLIFKGFLKVIMGFVEAVMNIGAAIVNTIISVVVSAINAIGRLIFGFIKGVIDAVNAVIGLVGIDPISYPDESLFIIQNVPQIVPPAFDYAFGAGGVVTGPTRALIGEAGRDEAVIPLDNSPQMLDLIDKIADKVNQGGETVVKVYIGDREWDAFTYESAQRGQKLVGAQPIREGRA